MMAFLATYFTHEAQRMRNDILRLKVQNEAIEATIKRDQGNLAYNKEAIKELEAHAALLQAEADRLDREALASYHKGCAPTFMEDR